MNYFIELKIFERDRRINVRPEAVAAVQSGDEFDEVILNTGDTYWVEKGQFILNTLMNKNTHAGMRVR